MHSLLEYSGMIMNLTNLYKSYQELLHLNHPLKLWNFPLHDGDSIKSASNTILHLFFQFTLWWRCAKLRIANRSLSRKPQLKRNDLSGQIAVIDMVLRKRSLLSLVALLSFLVLFVSIMRNNCSRILCRFSK